MKKLSYIYFYFIIFFFIGTTFSLLIGWFPMIEIKWLWITIQLILTVVFFKNVLNKKHIVLLLVYFFVLLFNLLIGDTYFNANKVLLEMLTLLSVTTVFPFIVNDSTQHFIFKYLILFFVVICITFIGTSAVYSIDPEIIRNITYALNGGDNSWRFMYAKLGVESYAFAHALPVLIPAVIYSLKNNEISKLVKLLLLFLLLLILALIVMSTATTAVLLSIFLIIISWIWNEKSKTKNIRNFLILFLGGLFLIITKDLIIDALFYLLENNESRTYAGKIEDFILFAETGEADGEISGRGKLYQESIDVFFNNMIIGSNDNTRIGGHSVFLDRMAMLGLVGFIPFIMFIYSYFKFVEKYLLEPLKPYLWISFVFIVLMGISKSIWSYDYLIIIFFTMPSFMLYINKYAK